MAANTGDLKGYDHQFVEPPPNDLLCLICLCVARDPQQINCCGKLLCKGCLEEHKKRSNNCPQCREDIITFADKKSERNILSLRARCDNKSNGCEWVGELRLLDEHMATCDFTLLPCPNKCQNGDKTVQLLRKDMEKHTRECPRRQYECPHCHEAGEYNERTTRHLETCPMLEVPCPKPECRIRVARCDLLKHRNECLFEVVPCKYETIGCKVENLRKEIAKHEGDAKEHLQLAVDTVREQESMLAHLRSREMPMKYKFATFDHYKITDDDIFTPAFYTSPGGYKMCINMFANGHKEGKGTHVSIYAYLMKGENDNHLPWPFTGTVTVELLNQLEDKNHHSQPILWPPDQAASQRVVSGERSSIGYGIPTYISHSALGYNAAKNLQAEYLKDDCLYFSIRVDAESSFKPWLV